MEVDTQEKKDIEPPKLDESTPLEEKKVPEPDTDTKEKEKKACPCPTLDLEDVRKVEQSGWPSVRIPPHFTNHEQVLTAGTRMRDEKMKPTDTAIDVTGDDAIQKAGLLSILHLLPSEEARNEFLKWAVTQERGAAIKDESKEKSEKFKEERREEKITVKQGKSKFRTSFRTMPRRRINPREGRTTRKSDLPQAPTDELVTRISLVGSARDSHDL